MKNKRLLKWLRVLAVVLCLALTCGLNFTSAFASEEKYEWHSVECIAIAPPYTYAQGTASFQVCFDKDVTSVNYKHLAAGATALKTFSRYDVPNMTYQTIDSLDASGVLDSINDCIAFNGVKIRELQKLSPLAVMVHVGELGANNTMNIDFNGSISEVKIVDFNQSFTFTFYEGLKFPSGVEVKQTVSWVYNPETRTFSQIPNENDPKNCEFSVFYNGQQITKDDNLVVIYDEDAFSFDNLSVKSSSPTATIEIEPQFETLNSGYNYVLITCRAENNVDFKHLQVVFDLQQVEEEIDGGCNGAITSGGFGGLIFALGAFLIKRSKRV